MEIARPVPVSPFSVMNIDLVVFIVHARYSLVYVGHYGDGCRRRKSEDEEYEDYGRIADARTTLKEKAISFIKPL